MKYPVFESFDTIPTGTWLIGLVNGVNNWTAFQWNCNEICFILLIKLDTSAETRRDGTNDSSANILNLRRIFSLCPIWIIKCFNNGYYWPIHYGLNFFSFHTIFPFAMQKWVKFVQKWINLEWRFARLIERFVWNAPHCMVFYKNSSLEH